MKHTYHIYNCRRPTQHVEGGRQSCSFYDGRRADARTMPEADTVQLHAEMGRAKGSKIRSSLIIKRNRHIPSERSLAAWQHVVARVAMRSALNKDNYDNPYLERRCWKQ